MLLSIAKQYSIIYDYSKSIQVAKVTTAIPLTTELETKVMAKIVELTNNKASLENIVNPSILGGFILRVGDVQYDASISNHLNELRKEFDNSHYIPKI
jgi:F-type H+-transporting ATPase subunit delta